MKQITIIKCIVFSACNIDSEKKDYVRQGDQFISFGEEYNLSRIAEISLKEGDTMDARGSVHLPYRRGSKRKFSQNWAKFTIQDGELVAMNYDDEIIKLPDWIETRQHIKLDINLSYLDQGSLSAIQPIKPQWYQEAETYGIGQPETEQIDGHTHWHVHAK